MTLLQKFFDVRPAESRPVMAAFGSLFFIVVAHTLLETARDALFLVYVGPKALGYMYIVAAALTFSVGALSSRLGARLGARRALVIDQLASAAGAAIFFFVPPTKAALTALYALSVVSGALLVPQLWAATAALFHAGQARRLFGTIAAAGVLGAVVGSSAGAAALLVVDLHWLLIASAAAYAISSALIIAAPPGRARPAPEPSGPGGTWWGAFREEPALGRVALVVALGAATTLAADYLFKVVAAASVEPARLGAFLARSYAAMNVLALAVQVLVARRALARAGVIGTVGMMPSFMLLGGAFGFATGGSLFSALGTRAVDGALRHSVQRTGLELVYLAVPASARDRARPLIEGLLTRLSQAVTAGLLLWLAAPGRGSVRWLSLAVACLAAAWLAATAALRGPYVALFRRALLGPGGAEARSPEELDLASVELLIEALSSPQPREVIAAMRALERRGRAGLIPGLVLLRDDDEVLECAFEIFGSAARSDWVRFAERRLSDRRERVRRAAMRALARARRVSGGEREGNDAVADRPWIRGYLAVDAIARGASEDGDLAALLTSDDDGREARLGALRALADASASPRLSALLTDVVEGAPQPLDRETVALAASAAKNLHAVALAPWFVGRLAFREGRPAARSALAALGEPAFDRLATVLVAPKAPRLFRAQVPDALAEFGTQQAADVLLAFLSAGDDGLIRHRSLLALERMAINHSARFAAGVVRAPLRRELEEHFRLLAMRGVLARPAGRPASGDPLDLLLRLLDEKSEQAFGRTFRLLQLCFPDEDLRRVQAAAAPGDAARRANVAEFLDELLAQQRRRDDETMRALLRLAIEDLPDPERVARAHALARLDAPEGVGAVIDALRRGRDPALASLALAIDDEHVAALAAIERAGGRAAEAEGGVGLPGILPTAGAHGR